MTDFYSLWWLFVTGSMKKFKYLHVSKIIYDTLRFFIYCIIQKPILSRFCPDLQKTVRLTIIQLQLSLILIPS